MKKILLGAIIALSASVLVPAPAQAALTTGALVTGVERSAAPNRAFHRLSAYNKKRYVNARRGSIRLNQRRGALKALPAPPTRVPLKPIRCSRQTWEGVYEIDVPYREEGITLGHDNVTFEWCHNGTRVTKYKTYNIDSWMTYPGLSYKGATVSYYNAGWEMRSRTRFLYQFAWDKLGFQRSWCVQIRGGYGLASTSSSCNMGAR